MEIFTLLPLAQCEIEGVEPHLIDAMFGGALKHSSIPCDRSDIHRRVLIGGYPEAVSRRDDRRRRAWFETYLTTMVQRNIEEMSQIEAVTAIPRLLRLLAARTSSPLNLAAISRDVGLPYTTLQRYLSLLEAAFLVDNLPAWSENLTSRLVKSPKVHLSDTGLVAHLLGLQPHTSLVFDQSIGRLLESFIVGELRKQAAWSDESPNLYHFRTHAGAEVDIVMEGRARRIVGIEVKSSTTLKTNDFKGLRALAEVTGERFVCGVVFYLGTETVPFGPGLWAVPVSALWEGG